MPNDTLIPAIGLVLIGRNEGERLVRCLASVPDEVSAVVYVDSNSSDDSVQQARNVGAHVVELDLSRPFTAARARNAGYAALKAMGVPLDFVQFVDGDCAIVDGWVAAASEALVADPGLGIVTGWRAEIHPDTSVYNALCDFEWHRPAGSILTCGGDMMVRVPAFDGVGGFDDTVIAAEDDEFCVRIRKAGWKIERLPLDMTRHDAAMMRFSQWWKRAVRTGHGFAQVGDLHADYFTRERTRAWFYGAVLPAVAAIGLFVSAWIVLAVLGIYVLSYLRTTQGLMQEGLPRPSAMRQAVLLSLSKLPNVVGMLTYLWRRKRAAPMKIIEYK
ncbi:glycosyltransferase [Ruegeria conchae]|uniref:GT2 family glycosyltransferase n=1 Tax=Ruegeria conchae TaxID=981384 RepID=A0A497ZF61_9RHOB|nr:glycosyltransferase [Ruegeria conchae]RLK07340.1 GT2 family glycosyltransferase [Ruegeria conchae]